MLRKHKEHLTIYEKGRGTVPSLERGIQDKVYGKYLETLDPRGNEGVQLALAASPDNRFLEFLERIKSTKYRRVSLQTIAKGCNIGLVEFQDWRNKQATSEAIARAQQASVNITRDMAEDALSQEGPCDRCDALGWVAAPPGLPRDTPGYRLLAKDKEGDKFIRTCPSCKGEKYHKKPGDTHSRNIILEMSGIIKKGGNGVNLNVNFGGASHSSAVGDLEAMTISAEAEEIP